MIKGLPTLAAKYNIYVPIAIMVLLLLLSWYFVKIKHAELSTIFACIIVVANPYLSNLAYRKGLNNSKAIFLGKPH